MKRQTTNTLRPPCLRAQADIFMELSKLWQYLGQSRHPCLGKNDAIACG